MVGHVGILHKVPCLHTAGRTVPAVVAVGRPALPCGGDCVQVRKDVTVRHLGLRVPAELDDVPFAVLGDGLRTGSHGQKPHNKHDAKHQGQQFFQCLFHSASPSFFQ